MDIKSNIWNVLSWLFGIVVLAIGFLNSFWGNDLGFGIFLILLSLVYFPPSHFTFKKITGFSIHLVLKIMLVIFIIWAALGVGELFNKIKLMMIDLG
ncbi:hypothetical protein [Flavobacterium glaciei]|uniref:Uncharacterized protein n=1 Tax=Flavobacterium glaciei TaxID=386300 RepID=A0A562PPS7_9FLAO|nr:hypothetical protein [Flavobacterium glaciei]RDI53560.1 hypothetical protein DFR66_109125 [Flavobacterium glaciei]TWI46461.1 hypothetical protein IQ02_01985 [Flavobacterium glaciei]